MEYPRLVVVTMLIALANLATDITRLLLELSHPSASYAPMPMQARAGPPEPPMQEALKTPRQEIPNPAPDMRQSEPAQKKVETSGIGRARGPPREREFGARVPFSQLPRDFSINCPPWRWACREPMYRYR